MTACYGRWKPTLPRAWISFFVRLVPSFIGQMHGTSGLDLAHLRLEPFTHRSISSLQKKNWISSFVFFWKLIIIPIYVGAAMPLLSWTIFAMQCNAFLLCNSLLCKASLRWGLWQPSNVLLRLVTIGLLDGDHMRCSGDVNRNNMFCRYIGCYCLAVLQIRGEFLRYDIQTATSLLSPTGPCLDPWIREVYLVWPIWLVLRT
jgi:hypothetical protein